MKQPGDAKIRMLAAERLAEILIIREQRDIAELKAEARKAEASAPSPEGTPESPAELTAEEAATQFLAKVRAQREAV